MTNFGPDAWPSMHDFTWNKQVYDYYAVSPITGLVSNNSLNAECV